MIEQLTAAELDARKVEAKAIIRQRNQLTAEIVNETIAFIDGCGRWYEQTSNVQLVRTIRAMVNATFGLVANMTDDVKEAYITENIRLLVVKLMAATALNRGNIPHSLLKIKYEEWMQITADVGAIFSPEIRYPATGYVVPYIELQKHNGANNESDDSGFVFSSNSMELDHQRDNQTTASKRTDTGEKGRTARKSIAAIESEDEDVDTNEEIEAVEEDGIDIDGLEDPGPSKKLNKGKGVIGQKRKYYGMDIHELRVHLRSLMKTNLELRTQVAKLKTDNHWLETNVAQLKTEVTQLKPDVVVANTQARESKETRDEELGTVIVEHTRQIDEHKHTGERFKQKENITAAENTRLTDENLQYSSLNQQLSARVAELEKMLVKRESATTVVDNTSLKVITDQETDRLLARVIKLKREAATREKHIGTLEAEVGELRAEIRMTKDQLNAANIRYENIVKMSYEESGEENELME